MKFLLTILLITSVVGKAETTAFEASVAKAKSTLSKITYLPYRFRADGCYARAFYASMELAANDIVPHVQIVSGEFEVGGWTWLLHAAPVLLGESDDEIKIIDHSFSELPLAIKDWLVLLKPTREPVKYVIPGSVYAGADDLSKKQEARVKSLKALPPFKSSEVEDACNDLREKWEQLEYPPPFQKIDPKIVAESQAARKKLKGRTKELRTLLKAKALWEGPEVIDCEKADVE